MDEYGLHERVLRRVAQEQDDTPQLSYAITEWQHRKSSSMLLICGFDMNFIWDFWSGSWAKSEGPVRVAWSGGTGVSTPRQGASILSGRSIDPADNEALFNEAAQDQGVPKECGDSVRFLSECNAF